MLYCLFAIMNYDEKEDILHIESRIFSIRGKQKRIRGSRGLRGWKNSTFASLAPLRALRETKNFVALYWRFHHSSNYNQFSIRN